MTQFSRDTEINIIAHGIPGSDSRIIGKKDNLYVVDTLDGISLYSNEEMKEIYNVDCDNGNLERLGWSA